VLESRHFGENDAVIKEGDAGEEFFLIESGLAVATKKDANGNETVVKQLSKGDYFGGEWDPSYNQSILPFPASTVKEQD
jgi:cAMP-dependent protein kinase regulator